MDTLDAPEGQYDYAYAGNGKLVDTFDLPNGAYIDNAYDTMARLEDTWLKTSGGTVRNHHACEYNRAHRRARQTLPDSSTVDYTYTRGADLSGTLEGTGDAVPDKKDFLSKQYLKEFRHRMESTNRTLTTKQALAAE